MTKAEQVEAAYREGWFGGRKAAIVLPTPDMSVEDEYWMARCWRASEACHKLKEAP